MKALREQTVADLEARVIENRKQLLDLRFQLKLGNKVKTHMIRKLKREIQVIKTLLSERVAS
ncbi:MAG: 50S ribosomal protein L29 [Legionellales bacterium]|nr:50S ribosomal protein L29 [Legionellales bacterium]|tara:strand:- start:3416 stop:3601 length:186 start_codon:yes stop_codon:yes gene_type:complete